MTHPRMLVLGALAGVACGRPSAPAVEQAATPRELRVCADPNNLPFSNAAEQGFENRIAKVLARELDATLQYVWSPQRRGFIRNGLNADRCDVVIGLATDVDMALTSRPYYRSTYVFVRPHDAAPLTSLDDPQLAKLRIGVQLVGDDYFNTPPAHALARRGLVRNLVGFTVYGDYARESPPADIVRAVRQDEIDVAIAWGPLAAYYARREEPALVITPVPDADPDLPMRFELSLAVKRGRTALLAELERVLEARKAEIDGILDDYAVPRA